MGIFGFFNKEKKEENEKRLNDEIHLLKNEINEKNPTITELKEYAFKPCSKRK